MPNFIFRTAALVIAAAFGFPAAAAADIVKVASPAGAEKSLLMPQQGLWFDPEDNGSGFGIGLSEVEGSKVLSIIWYTYDEQGNPVWYAGSGPYSGTLAEVPLFAFAPDPSPVGAVSIGFTSSKSADLSWHLGEQRGERSLVLIEASPTAPVESFTGQYYPPSEPGWGTSALLETHQSGEARAIVLYIYDEDGSPTWVLSSEATELASGEIELPMLQFKGSCPSCLYQSPTSVPAGSVKLDVRGERAFDLSSDIRAPGVSWQRPPTPFAPLTLPVDAGVDEATAKVDGSSKLYEGAVTESSAVALDALKGAFSSELAKSASCVTVTRNPENVSLLNLPSQISLSVMFDGVCGFANGITWQGGYTLSATGIHFDQGVLKADVAVRYDALRRDGKLIADGSVSYSLDFAGTAFVMSGSAAVVFGADGLRTQSGTLGGSFAASVEGLNMRPDPLLSAAGGDFFDAPLAEGYSAVFEGLALDGESIDGRVDVSGQALSDGGLRRTIEFDLVAAGEPVNGVIEERRQPTQPGGTRSPSYWVSSSAPVIVGPYRIGIDGVRYEPGTCLYYPIDGALRISNGAGFTFAIEWDASCDGSYQTTYSSSP